MITSIGKITIAQALPFISLLAGDMLTTVLTEIANIQAEALALKADLLAFEDEFTSLLSDLESLKSLATDIQRQISEGVSGLERSVRAAIENILSGAALTALQQVLLGGIAALVASAESALATTLSKAAILTNRIASIEARIASIQGRIANTIARITALLARKVQLFNLQDLMAAGGLHVFAYNGATSSFGTELQAEIGSGLSGGAAGDIAYGLVFATNVGATWTALASIFKTVP